MRLRGGEGGTRDICCFLNFTRMLCLNLCHQNKKFFKDQSFLCVFNFCVIRFQNKTSCLQYYP